MASPAPRTNRGVTAQLPLTVAHHLAGHHGIVDRTTLLTSGVSADQISRRLAADQLIAVHRGVYRSAEWPDTELGRCAAACAAIPSAAVSHQTAGRLWGLRRCAGDTIHLVAPGEVRTHVGEIELHLTGRLLASEVVRRADGIVVTSPVRTVCDLAAVLPDDDLESVLEHALDLFHLKASTLVRAADDYARQGRIGSARLRRVVQARGPGAPVGSGLELRLARALVRAGLPAPVRQHEVRLHGGTLARVDLAYPAIGFAIEIDHPHWHGVDAADADRRRDRRARIVGFETTRVPAADLRPEAITATVRELVALYESISRERRARAANF